jgi:hypothetical protein
MRRGLSGILKRGSIWSGRLIFPNIRDRHNLVELRLSFQQTYSLALNKEIGNTLKSQPKVLHLVR